MQVNKMSLDRLTHRQHLTYSQGPMPRVGKKSDPVDTRCQSPAYSHVPCITPHAKTQSRSVVDLKVENEILEHLKDTTNHLHELGRAGAQGVLTSH